MAVIQLQPAVRLSVVDASDSIGHFGLWIRRGASAAQGRAALAQLRQLLPTECSPAYDTLRYELVEDQPAAGAGDATRCAVFVFETEAAGQLAVISVPGLRGDLVDPAAPELVNLTAAPVQALISALQTGIWCNRFGYSLTNCIAALVSIRNP